MLGGGVDRAGEKGAGSQGRVVGVGDRMYSMLELYRIVQESLSRRIGTMVPR